MQHAFDSSGRLYNENGKLEEWWTEETSEAFNEKQQCISKQYSKYTIDDGKGGKAHVNVCPNVPSYLRMINDVQFHRVNCKCSFFSVSR